MNLNCDLRSRTQFNFELRIANCGSKPIAAIKPNDKQENFIYILVNDINKYKKIT